MAAQDLQDRAGHHAVDHADVTAGVVELAQPLGDPDTPVAVHGVLDDPNPGPVVRGAAVARALAADARQILHDRVLAAPRAGSGEEVVGEGRVDGANAVGPATRRAWRAWSEHREEVLVDRLPPDHHRLVPLTGVAEAGEVHRGLEGDVVLVVAAHVVEQEVLRVWRPARPTARAPALAGEAHRVGRLGMPGHGQSAAEPPLEPFPRLLLLVGALGGHHLHTHAPCPCGGQRVGDGPVVEGPRGDPDGAVAGPGRAEAGPRTSPRALDGAQHPVADRHLRPLAAVGVGEVAAGRGHVGPRGLADDPRRGRGDVDRGEPGCDEHRHQAEEDRALSTTHGVSFEGVADREP